MTTLINKTPHRLNIYRPFHPVLILEPDGDPIRLEEFHSNLGTIEGLDVTLKAVRHGRAKLPPLENDVFYIVSAMVARAYPDRRDFLIPGPAVRDEEGNIIGCDGLAIYLG